MRLHPREGASCRGLLGRDPEALSIALADFERATAGASSTAIVGLDLDGTQIPTLIREVQRHPFRPGVLHVDFYEIHEGVTITLNVPIHLVGTPVGVHTGGGVLDQVLREVEIEVLPRHIPPSIDLDVAGLDVGKSFHVSDLLVENATVLADPGATVCTVVPPRVEEAPGAVMAPELEEEVEPELIRRREEGEGEADAGG